MRHALPPSCGDASCIVVTISARIYVGIFVEHTRDDGTDAVLDSSQLTTRARRYCDDRLPVAAEPLVSVVRTVDEALAALGVQSSHFEPLERPQLI